MNHPSNPSPVQLSLEVSLSDDSTFANFYCNQNNFVALQALKQFSCNQGDQNLVLWGAHHCGLTHLLQACNHEASLSALKTQYIPLAEVMRHTPESVFDGLEGIDLVCLDGIERICGSKQWELGVFHFYNRLRDSGRRLLLSSHISPVSLALDLPDLKSRVMGSSVYHILAMDDDDKSNALVMRAKTRGMDMPDEVARFILSRAPRDTVKLFQLLNQLDTASLQQQRKLTIPFVKSLLPA